jgi:signal peptidase I
LTSLGRRALAFAIAFGLPLVVTLATLAFLLPTRLESRTGLGAWLSRVADAEPLLLGLALFLVSSLAVRHWQRPVEASAHASGVAPRRRSAVRFAVGLAVVAVLACGVRVSVVAVHRVEGPSMVPTLGAGDRVLVNQLAYGLRLPLSTHVLGARPPRRGDVVVFPNQGRVTGAGAPRDLVKRVIGLPGDVLAYRDGTPVVNGWAVPSCDAGPYLVVAGGALARGRVVVEFLDGRSYLTLRSPLEETLLPERKVPAGEVFVLGDDRLASTDSRAWSDGRGVHVDRLEGRVTRLAFGRFRNGRLDLRRAFATLGLGVREPNADVSAIEARVADCLAHAPPSSPPPAPDSSP